MNMQRINSELNSVSNKSISAWETDDAQKAVETRRAAERHLEQRPGVQKSKRDRQLDEEYDKGRERKVKKFKPRPKEGALNPFQQKAVEHKEIKMEKLKSHEWDGRFELPSSNRKKKLSEGPPDEDE
jgi:hypothetical protein